MLNVQIKYVRCLTNAKILLLGQSMQGLFRALQYHSQD